MKNRIIYMMFAALSLSMFSCDKESADVSHITNYPVFTINGDEAMTLTQGGTYTEQGAEAMEGDEDITSKVQITGSVDVNTLGVYTITYTAANKDGLTTSARRYVGVISPAIVAMDISGKYKRDAGQGGIATVKKTAYPGLYTNDNPGGIAEAGEVIVYMFHTDVAVVSAPSQETSVGEFACTDGTYNSVAPASFSWKCINSGYGTAIRTFIKQ